MMRRIPWWTVAVVLVTAPARADLTLHETLESAIDAHPYVVVADAKVEQADAKLMQARGEFDLKVSAEGQWDPVGTYSKLYGEVGVSQPTPIWGSELKAGYRNGQDFQVYDGGWVTSELGEAVIELFVPLLRDGPIDERRMARIRAKVGREQAQQEARLLRAELLAGASASWWKWVVQGRKRAVYAALLQLAEDRRTLLSEQVDMGAVAAIEVTDNHRLVASRRAAVAQQELELARGALRLGLYRRTAEGEPAPPTTEELPSSLPATVEPNPLMLTRALSELDDAPRARVIRLSFELLDQELRLARNRALPRVDFRLKASQGMGPERPYAPFADSLSETKVLGSVGVELDVQRRKALGKAAELQARRSALDSRTRLLIDSMRLDVQAAMAALTWGHRQVELNREATDAAERLAEAERERFGLGQSSILNVNLREQAVLSARLAELDAVLAYHLAWIELQLLLGRDNIADFSTNDPAPAP